MVRRALQVVFTVPPDLGQQLVGYNDEACEYEVLAQPRPLNLQLFAMLLPEAVAVQVRSLWEPCGTACLHDILARLHDCCLLTTWDSRSLASMQEERASTT